ncbi:endonuclease/exonuclease/phosphatase family protein [Verrucomicrobiaceae bacterium R5-34]|uniref:Endonuclease/exonuclease/phosphatase family protein n=1 Tax=Oceaniferula flava TaxID=2800421 RepID=A0AAE2SC84_9BACT|nr:endonuclease/exonuclease/phosphatase family protein [Oceaniferula flavus]MBK1829634.1 endonuclease/exonuclease/phosphatase family protein [Verrucomicrobiaceae bacterium R5-34]MBK1853825.1 endonuclease/exonuclease/phosphatase family protein [Oceaniferula flavus]MBM1135131.1 endonuclease/exonuclease/phosphatase family protein [Oceaniferula flavus]
MILTCSVWAGELRVFSYNIHHGAGMDGALDLKRIAEVIKKQKPDIVALQEVDKHVPRSGKVDQAAELAKLLGMHYAFGKCIDLQGGEYGNAILSKYPIRDTFIHPLPGPGEPRAVLEVILNVKGKKLSFASVHLDWKENDTRVAQISAMEKVLSLRNYPVIIAGDFNAKPDSEAMRLLATTWSLTPKSGARLTMPANDPDKEIDYIAYRGFESVKASCLVLEEELASDHRPLIGVILLP